MGVTFSSLNISSLPIKQMLQNLDGHVILSHAEYDYRYNILDLHHKRHSSKIKRKDGKVETKDKEWAFGHIIIKNGAVYFSQRPTTNGDVEGHSVSNSIYSSLNSNEIFDIDRNARLIDLFNVNLMVQSILALRSQNLIP